MKKKILGGGGFIGSHLLQTVNCHKVKTIVSI